MWNSYAWHTFAERWVCSNACGVIRFDGVKEHVTSACIWSKLSTTATPLTTAELSSTGFCALLGFTGWNVLVCPPCRFSCWPVSAGAGGAMFSVRRRTVFGLSGWSLPRPTDDADIWRNRGLSSGTTTLVSSFRCIWLRSISSRVEAFWWLTMSWIPAAECLTQQQQHQFNHMAWSNIVT